MNYQTIILEKEKQKRESEDNFEEIRDYILEAPSAIKGQTRPHLPVAVKKILREEFGTKCAVKNCQKLATEIHHNLPFSIGETHDPRFLVPLCKEHHELQHAVNLQYKEIRQKSQKT